jgi:SAM-dependent methyltransferase
MLDEAAREAADFTNIGLIQTDGSSFADVPSDLDLVHSFIVFQHIDAERGYKIINNLLSLVKVGGGVAFHVIVHRHTSKLRKTLNYLRKHIWPFHVLANLAAGRPALDPIMQMNTYSLNSIALMMVTKGFEAMIAERYGNYMGYESYFVFGRRTK